MNHVFDDLARAMAKGISRRQAIKQVTGTLAGSLLWSGSLKHAFAAVTCGTCQACDLDSGTCDSACTPSTAGQMLCTAVSNDGSYLRLTKYLNANNYQVSSSSNTALFYRNGELAGSGLTTLLTSSSVPGASAQIFYAVDINGNASAQAVLLQDGQAVAGLTVDPSGRVPLSIIQAAPSASASGAAAQSKAGFPSATSKGLAAVPRLSASVMPALEPSPECEEQWSMYCGVLGAAAYCGAVVYFICLFASEGIGALACAEVAGLICAYGTDAFCKNEAAYYCCSNGGVACNGVCCDPCQICSGNQCVAHDTCSKWGLGACCGPHSMCCPTGYTCVNGTCTSPNSGCVGATCSTFVPCSTNTDCVCGTVAEGGGLCVPGSTACAGLTECTSTADCESGSLCLIDSCCGAGVCVPVSLTCPPQYTTALPSKAAAAAGPTIGHR